MDEKRVLFSLIVPVYNPGKHLVKCVSSILEQTFDCFECILVDDGSNDGSEKIIDEYSKRDERIVVIHKKNGGESSARNAGLDVAQGHWVIFVDSDDYIEHDTLFRLKKYIDEIESKGDEDIDIIGFEHNSVYLDGRTNDDLGARKRFHGLIDRERAIEATIDICAYVVCMCYKREIATSVRFDEKIHWGPDAVYLMEVMHRIRKMYWVSDVLYHYVQTTDSAARAGFNKKQLTALDSSDWILRFVAKNYPSLIGNAIDRYVNTRVNLYYKMYLCDDEYVETMKDVYCEMRREYPRLISLKKISIKSKLKYSVFYRNPNLYCWLFRKLVNRIPGDKYAMYKG